MGSTQPPAIVPARWAGPAPSLLISTKLELHAYLHTCPHAQTYEAYSTLYRCTVWIPLKCNQWSCRQCAEYKIAQLARRCSSALPNRLLTLTVDPDLWETQRDAFDGTRRHVPTLFRRLRNKFGDIEYLRVTELTRRGWPHYHCLVRSGFLPHPVVRDIWRDLTGATIVDLRHVKDRCNTYYYLVKYLSKMHDLGWTNRHVSYSKGFFRDSPPSRPDDLGLSEGKVIETHPANLLYHQFRTAKLTELRYGVFALDVPDDVARDCSLPPEPTYEHDRHRPINTDDSSAWQKSHPPPPPVLWDKHAPG